jgi:hypothetical protein
MLFLLACLLGLLAGLASGGSLRGLTTIRFRWPLLVVVAFVVKEAGTAWPLAHMAITPYLFVVSLAALIAWAVWHARQLPGMWLVALGMASNLLVVLANGGRMPAYRGTPSVFKILLRGPIGQYVLGGPSTRLGFLADWIGIPGPLGVIFPQGYSPGDLIVMAGLVVVLFMATRRSERAFVDKSPSKWHVSRAFVDKSAADASAEAARRP